MYRLAKNLFMTLALFSALFSGQALADPLDDIRTAGYVGEKADGLLGLVDPGAPASAKSLMQSINSKRMARYQELAAENGTPVEAVQKMVANKLKSRLQPGWYYMDAAGSWKQK